MATDLVYLQNAEMRKFYDLRRLKDLLTDDGTGDALTTTIIDDPTTAAGDILWNAINWASSEIDAKCQNGRRYARADLELIVQEAIAPPPGSTAAQIEGYKKRAAVLKKLCADLAFGFLAQRRATTADKLRELAPAYEEALFRLEELYDGKRIFDLDAALGATVPTRKKLGRLANLTTSFNRMFGVWPDDNHLYPR